MLYKILISRSSEQQKILVILGRFFETSHGVYLSYVKKCIFFIFLKLSLPQRLAFQIIKRKIEGGIHRRKLPYILIAAHAAKRPAWSTAKYMSDTKILYCPSDAGKKVWLSHWQNSGLHVILKYLKNANNKFLAARHGPQGRGSAAISGLGHPGTHTYMPI